MPVHQTIDPIEATAKAVDALLAAIEGNPSPAQPSPGAAAAYKSAIARHGRALHAEAGPEALAAVLTRIRADATDRARGEERERIVLAAWEGIAAPNGRAA